jgi:hypothetical protein
MQANHCEQGMVFAINPPATGAKDFDNFKANAMSGSTSTVVATSTTSVTYSVTSTSTSSAATATGTNINDGSCQCVCNIDLSNGYLTLVACTDHSAVNPNQGIGYFGGDLGNVQSMFTHLFLLMHSPLGS